MRPSDSEKRPSDSAGLASASEKRVPASPAQSSASAGLDSENQAQPPEVGSQPSDSFVPPATDSRPTATSQPRAGSAPRAGFVQPPPAWARAAADFDARVFGPDSWPLEVWAAELADTAAGTYRALFEDGGVSATPSIIALGGIRGGIEAEVLTIGVAPSHRGQGLGGLLLDELLSLAAADGAEEVFLEVRSRGEVARRLYESRGFVTVGLRRGYYRDDDALIMRLAFESADSWDVRRSR